MNLEAEKCAYSLVTAMTLSARRCIFSLDRSNFGLFFLSFKLRKCENSEYTEIRIFVFFCEIRDRRSESKPTKKTINTILCLRRSKKNLFLFFLTRNVIKSVVDLRVLSPIPRGCVWLGGFDSCRILLAVNFWCRWQFTRSVYETRIFAVISMVICGPLRLVVCGCHERIGMQVDKDVDDCAWFTRGINEVGFGEKWKETKWQFSWGGTPRHTN